MSVDGSKVLDRQSAEERVQMGASLLDQRRPGWVQSVDVDTLRLRSGCNCVIGQLYRSGVDDSRGYVRGLQELGLDPHDDAQHLGFNLIGEQRSQESFDALTTAWRSAILARRLELAQPPC